MVLYPRGRRLSTPKITFFAGNFPLIRPFGPPSPRGGKAWEGAEALPYIPDQSCFAAFIFTPGPMVLAATQERIYWPLAAAGLALMMAPMRAV